MAKFGVVEHAVTVVIIAFALLNVVSAEFAVFEDVTISARIDFTPADKTSSPTIADLNGDGFLDIIQCNHARKPIDIFYGSRSGKFKKYLFFEGDNQDRHGTAIADIDEDGFPDIILALGIATRDRGPRDAPQIARTVNRRKGNLQVVDGDLIGLRPTADQGPSSRIAVRMMDVDQDGDLDMFLFGRPVASGFHHNLFTKENLAFNFENQTGLEMGPIQGFLVTDYNMDGLLDIVMFNSGLKIFRNNGRDEELAISFTEVTDEVFPRRYLGRKFGGAAEFDYDNDGDFDLYFGGGVKVKFPYREGNDLLLENNGDGTFSDRSESASLPRGGAHMGVTVGDFDNNGFMDVFIPRAGPLDLRISDIMAFNNGDKTFTVVEDHGANGPLGEDPTSAVGAQAFDYDRDGRVDVAVGSRLNPRGGELRLYRNISPVVGNYIIVKVPVAYLNLSFMDAIVVVTTPGTVFTRKAGSAGESRTQSFLQQVHVGIGNETSVLEVTVTITTGLAFVVQNPPINDIVEVGTDVSE